jgi:nicotinate-nucleotide adenylyltransferase
MKIGIFGGTFNPVHYGHLRAAEEVQEVFAFDRLMFVPAGQPPLKGLTISDPYHRYKMTKIALRSGKNFEISDIETKPEGPSYSVETVRRLKERYGKCDLFFIIGIDAFLDLPKWKQPNRLIELAHFIIITRPGFCFSDLSPSPYFPGITKKRLREFDRGKVRRNTLRFKTGKKAFLLKITGIDISSSRIRILIKQGKSIKYLLPESVESYIISHKLYKK